MTTPYARALTPWILALGAITLTTSIACGVGGGDGLVKTIATAGQQGWTLRTHPCAGSRTDALFCDDDSTCFTGCGSALDGRGMFMTRDGGQTWAGVASEPADFFEGSRVHDIWRSPDDGKLYVAGEHEERLRVVSVDARGRIGEVFKAKPNINFSFTAGSFRRAPGGRAVAESLTGDAIVYREQDSDDPLESWESGRDFPTDQVSSAQILAMDVLGGDFYAVGSTIGQPPMVMLPAWDGAFDFEILPLVREGSESAYTGELWDIDVTTQGIVVGGVNQDESVGMVHVFNFEGSLSPSALANWKTTSLERLFPGKPTWIQGTCRDHGVIYAVGRESREDWGLVIRSEDGGETWQDLSPYESGSAKGALAALSRCHVTSSGGVIVAGAGGLLARFED